VRILIFHVDSFTCTITQKGRSSLVEEPVEPSMHIDDGFLVLASAEAGDEAAPDAFAEGTAAEVARLAAQLKVRAVMLLPFAHLFAEPGREVYLCWQVDEPEIGHWYAAESGFPGRLPLDPWL